MNNTAAKIEAEAPIESTGTALALPDKKDAAKYFEPKGLEPIIEKIRAEVAAFKPDISTKAGRAAIASFAHKVAKSKTALDTLGKDMVAGMKEQVKVIDAERSRAWDEIEALQHQARKPLTDWEDAEKKRVEDHENLLNEITHLGHAANTPAELQAVLDGMEKYRARDWQEFSARAAALIETKTTNLTIRHVAAVKAEKDALELTRLRAEEEERQRIAREKKIAEDAAEKARKDAQDRADEAKRLAEAEQKKKDDAARLENDRLLKEKQDADARAQKAEDEKKAAEEKARKDKIAADKKAKDDAAAAVEAERQRVAKKKAEEEAATRKREADTAHAAKINNEALYDILSVLNSDDPDVLTDLEKSMGRELVKAIAKGEIRHVKITY